MTVQSQTAPTEADTPLMHAVRFHAKGGPEVLQYELTPRPMPGPGQVLARVVATGVNYADVMRRKGDNYPFPSPMPYTLGGEAVGVIEACGEGADRQILGTRAIVFPGVGCYADYVVVPQERVFPLPPGLEDAHAIALFVQGLTAALMLKRSARIAPGESVMVQGAAGGVGSVAVQMARHYGAGLVIGCASTPQKRQVVERLGADIAVDYGKPGWADEVRAATSGRGVDIVLEMAGGTVAAESFDLLAPFGRSVVYGNSSEDDWLLDTKRMPPRNVSVTGFYFRPFLEERDFILATLNEMAGLVSTGALQVQIGGTFKLSDAAQAHAMLEGRGASGKLILVPDQSAP